MLPRRHTLRYTKRMSMVRMKMMIMERMRMRMEMKHYVNYPMLPHHVTPIRHRNSCLVSEIVQSLQRIDVDADVASLWTTFFKAFDRTCTKYHGQYSSQILVRMQEIEIMNVSME